MKNYPSDSDISQTLKPWYSSFASIAADAEQAVLSGIAILGLPRPSERANDFHRVFRNLFRKWCDESNGLFRLIEERDGLGLDFLVCDLIPDKPFIIRFGRLKDDRVSRNSTGRQNSARKYGTLSSEWLFPDLDEPRPGELRQVTLAYTIQDEGTEAGRPRWYMEEVLLLVEHFDGIDRLAEIAHYSRPTSIAEDTRRAVAAPRQDQLELWRKQIRRASDGA